MASYWIALFSAQYGENRDAIFISMKTFNDDPDDQYPTFSLCFKGDRFHWNRDDNIFDSYALNATQYELMLKGEVAMMDELNKSSGLYEKKPVFLQNGADVNIDRYFVRPTDFIHTIKYLTEKEEHDAIYNSKTKRIESLESLFHLSYQTANTICFTRNTNDALKSIRRFDLINFNSSVIGHETYKDTVIQVFVHAPNQLVRSIDKPKYEASFAHFTSTLKGTIDKGPKVLEFKISQVQQLRKRSDSHVPCNEDFSKFDKYYQEQISQRLGCIPPYWKMDFPVQDQLEECRLPAKLKEANRIISNHASVLNLKQFPCTDMTLLSIDTINQEPSPQPDDITIAFFYPVKTYEEIKYSRMMGFAGWLSNVGGFIGIFLGYSIMQIPELLVCIVDFFHLKKYQSIRGK